MHHAVTMDANGCLPNYSIRPGNHADVQQIQTIEVAAGTLFTGVNMAEVAADPPPDGRLLRRLMSQGQLWVAECGEHVVGYATVLLVDADAHLDQVSVDPEHSRRGVGTALIDRCDRWATSIAATRMTLFTFADVPWNAPLYRRMGFVEIEPNQLGAELQELWQRECETDLHTWHRVAMARNTGRSPI